MNDDATRKPSLDAAESQTPRMCGNSMRENLEIQATPSSDGGGGRSGKAVSRTPDTDVAWKSDDPIVPAKRANKGDTRPGRASPAESVEERGSPKGNADQKASPRTQSHNGGSHRLGRVRQVRSACFVFRTPDRNHPREEPYEVVPHVRI